MSYSVVNVDEVDAAGPGGAVRFVRRELGIEAFGINFFELPPGAEGREHDETGSGQEEASVTTPPRQVPATPGWQAPVVVVRGPGSYEPRGPF